MTNFTPVESLAGGALIGAAAGAFLLVHGRIAGCSGLFRGLFALGADGKQAVATLFLGGLVAGGAVVSWLTGSAAPLPALSAARYAASGLLVGFGTTLGGGCTSGHGVCGLARGSLRSLAAVSTFFVSGCAAAVAAGARAGFSLAPLRLSMDASAAAALVAASLSALAATAQLRRFNLALCGATFGAGLALSGMASPLKVTAFLDVTGQWDPSLACVMASALAVSALSYAAKRRWLHAPLAAPAFCMPSPAARVDARLLAGSALFGAGWGLSGLCPGPAIATLGLPALGVSITRTALPFLAAMAAGSGLASALPASAGAGRRVHRPSKARAPGGGE